MSAKFNSISAAIYSGLWKLQIFRKLDKEFPDQPIKMVVFVTDHPPAILIKIDKGTFDITSLDDIKAVEDLESLDCAGYLAAPMSYILGGPMALEKGKKEGKVKMKNESRILLVLGKIISLLSA